MRFGAITHALISHSIKVLLHLHIGFRISGAEKIVRRDQHRGWIEASIRSSPCIVDHDSYLSERSVSWRKWRNRELHKKTTCWAGRTSLR